jgi:hypothetical protein
MTRFEQAFPPDIVRAVLDKIELRKHAETVSNAIDCNVISLAEYRNRFRQKSAEVVL